MMKRFNMQHTPPDEVLSAGHEVVHDGGGHESVGVDGDVSAPPLPLLLPRLLQPVVIVEGALPQLCLAQAHVPEGRVNLATSPANTNHQTINWQMLGLAHFVLGNFPILHILQFAILSADNLQPWISFPVYHS